jgi:hypothetical protein
MKMERLSQHTAPAMAVRVFPALAITWPQGVINEEDTQAGAAQVNGGVREWQERQVQLAVTPSRSPSL